MSNPNTIKLTAELAAELEEWGKLTARVFGKLRQQTAGEEIFKLIIPKLTRPKHIPKGQAWFWSNEWQKREKEANKELKSGRYDKFENVEELLKDLHRHV